jgi:hypothetical protein
MRLFKRRTFVSSPCPRCSQLVSEAEPVCPMCGWDQGDAYQGPAASPHGRPGHADASDEAPSDHRVA